MWRMRVWMVAVLLFAGCVTPYGSAGLMGGVRDRQISADTFQIEVNGNGFTSSWTLEDYFHRRAKELCVQAGFADYEFQREVGSTSQLTGAKSTTEIRNGRAETTTRMGPTVTRSSVNGFVRCRNPKPESVSGAVSL